LPKVLVYITTAMTGLYVVLGLIILLTNYFDPIVSGTPKKLLGALLVVYGLFRVRYLFKNRNNPQ
jgi:hypothetical protein